METFLKIAPGIVTGIITGIIILLLEYKTGWFQRREGSRSIPGSTPARRGGPFPPDFVWMDIAFGILMFALVFAIVYFIVGFPLSEYTQGLTSTVLDKSDDPNVVTKTIGEGNTKSFYENSLFISVDKIESQFSVDGTISYGVTFTVGAPGYPTQTVEGAKNGDSLVYQMSMNYEIRVTSLGHGSLFSKDSADFTVIRLQR